MAEREARGSDGGGPGAPEVRHLNQEQLAERLGVSQRTIEGWRQRGRGPAYLRMGGRIAYRLADVERFELECLQKGSRARSGEP
jgi:transcriptional regulator with XRE-family HTH domain